MSGNQAEKEYLGTVIDFDCQIRHVLGSSTHQDLQETLSQVSFLVDVDTSSVNDKISSRSVTIELNKTDLEKLLNTLKSNLNI